MIRVVALLLALTGTLIPTLAAQPVPGASPTAPEIVATGYGEAKLRPDRATLVLAVVTRAISAAQASRLNADRIAPVLAALRRLGLPDSALSTSGFSVDIDEEYDARGETRRQRGYVARNAIRATISRLELLGTVIDTALRAGATEVGEVTLSSSAEAEGRRRAIVAATHAARADAEAAAGAMGGRLGSVIEVVVNPAGGARAAGRVLQLSEVRVAGEATAARTPILVSDLSTSVQVRLRAAFERRTP